MEAKLESLEKAIQGHRKSMDDLDNLVRIADLPSDARNEYKVENGKDGGIDSVVNLANGAGHDPKVCSAAFAIGDEAKSDINVRGIFSIIINQFP